MKTKLIKSAEEKEHFKSSNIHVSGNILANVSPTAFICVSVIGAKSCLSIKITCKLKIPHYSMSFMLVVIFALSLAKWSAFACSILL